MLNKSFVSPRGREARSWGYEIKYGPWQLVETVKQAQGEKPVEVLDSPENTGIAFVQAEHRTKEFDRQLIVSAWVSFPVSTKSQAKVREAYQRAFRTIQSLIKRKQARFLGDLRNASSA